MSFWIPNNLLIIYFLKIFVNTELQQSLFVWFTIFLKAELMEELNNWIWQKLKKEKLLWHWEEIYDSSAMVQGWNATNLHLFFSLIFFFFLKCHTN